MRFVSVILLLFISASSIAATSPPDQPRYSFDRNRVITLAGVVKAFEYAEPHSWLLIDVTDADGQVTTWQFESDGPGTLSSTGIRRSDLRPGTRVTIKGNPVHDGRAVARWIELIRNSDGKVFNPRPGFKGK